MKLSDYELKKLSKLLKDYLELTFSSTVATKIPHRIFAMGLLRKMSDELKRARKEGKKNELKKQSFVSV